MEKGGPVGGEREVGAPGLGAGGGSKRQEEPREEILCGPAGERTVVAVGLGGRSFYAKIL